MQATISKREQEQQEKESAKAFLLSTLEAQERPTIWTNLKSVSSSGMSRDMKLLTVRDGRIIDITWYAAKVCSVGSLRERNGQRVLRVGGCGMDMGFHVVYSLSYALGGDGYSIHHEWI